MAATFCWGQCNALQRTADVHRQLYDKIDNVSQKTTSDRASSGQSGDQANRAYADPL